ncbi:MAG TPA: hypothetical protein VM911_05240 [Pyrinomonadaceae bacterium]|jgi:hypothetical protein|nr:hypothetical protein [Pyrinomonadaceae bacterium]
MDTTNLPQEMEQPSSDSKSERWLIASDEALPLTETDALSLSAREESLLFDLIGKIDHKILRGIAVYIEVQGIAYRVLYGVYWRSIYSGIAYWGLRCEQIKGGMWADDGTTSNQVDIPICHTPEGWVVEGQSLNFLLYQDATSYALQDF